MKVNELMIGDWVQITHHHNPKPFVKVKQVGLTDFCDALEQIYPRISYAPISLTQEILEKNGYTCKRSLDKEIRSYNWTSPDRRVTLNDQNGSPWFCIIRSEGMMEEVMIGITYVHELQHALKLCKIKKEIIL